MIRAIPAPDVIFGLLMAVGIVSALSLLWSWFENSRWGMRWHLWRLRRRTARARRRGW